METDSQDTYGKASQTLTILFERRKKKIYLEKKKKIKDVPNTGQSRSRNFY